MASVSLSQLKKEYRDGRNSNFLAVKSIDLEIRDREFMVLVGPSGCGKSTTLRMIAGLEEITSGECRIGDRLINDVSPKDRDIAMVFQNYALYPHMNVYDNMAFGLKLMNHSKAEIEERVNEAADILGIESMLKRKPKALSGGQRQRVAVGRAIVRKPKVFLFDEPLSNLDAKMRVLMRTEISKLHAQLDSTMVYVTHDQVEAMTMGDRICVMKDGEIMQVDEPLIIYNEPQNMFVAGFIGSPPMNFFHGRIEQSENQFRFLETNPASNGFSVTFNDRLSRLAKPYENKEIILGIRPEDLEDSEKITNPNTATTILAKTEVSEPMGSETYLYLNTGAHPFIARVHSETRFDIGNPARITMNLEKAQLFDPKTELAIRADKA